MAAEPVAVLTPAEALDLVGHGLDPEAVGPLAGRPLLAVHARPGPDLDALVAVVRHLPCVTVAVADVPPDGPPPDVDVLVTSAVDPPRPWASRPEGVDEAVALLGAAAVRSPRASVVLAQVLRAGDGLSVEGGLTLESLAFSTLQAGPEFRAWLVARRPRTSTTPEDTTSPAVLADRHGDALAITLNRPTRRNAVDVRLRDAYVEAMRLAAVDPTVAAIDLGGAGPSFCSGGDLDEFGTFDEPATAHLVRTTRGPAWWTAQVADRLTAHVHGTCVGAGVELSAFACRVVAAPDATFRLPEVGMGLVPGSGGTVSIARRVGRQRCAYLALTGEPIDAETALSWGLIDEIQPRS